VESVLSLKLSLESMKRLALRDWLTSAISDTYIRKKIER